MRTLALAVLCLLSPFVNAIPVTYSFTGEFTGANFFRFGDSGAEVIYTDTSSAFVFNGTTFFNGDTLFTGTVTIDHEGSAPSHWSDPTWYSGQVLDWSVSFGGATIGNPNAAGSIWNAVDYNPGNVTIFDEVPVSSTLYSVDTAWLRFDFPPSYFFDDLPGELPVAFWGGAFNFNGITVRSDGQSAYGGVSGTINSLTRVDVPEPGTLGLLAAGLLGMAWTRRRAS